MALQPMQRTGVADTTVARTSARAETPSQAPAQTPDQGMKPLPLSIRDRFVRGMGAGALGGTQSAMLMSVPVAAVVMDASIHVAPKALKNALPFGTSAGSIALMALTLAGTGAVVGGVTAICTHDKVWAPTMAAVTGGITFGAIRGLQTKNWQGAAAGALIGGLTGFMAGRQVAKDAPARP